MLPTRKPPLHPPEHKHSCQVGTGKPQSILRRGYWIEKPLEAGRPPSFQVKLSIFCVSSFVAVLSVQEKLKDNTLSGAKSHATVTFGGSSVPPPPRNYPISYLTSLQGRGLICYYVFLNWRSSSLRQPNSDSFFL
jgi:hypothetical protein